MVPLADRVVSAHIESCIDGENYSQRTSFYADCSTDLQRDLPECVRARQLFIAKDVVPAGRFSVGVVVDAFLNVAKDSSWFFWG